MPPPPLTPPLDATAIPPLPSVSHRLDELRVALPAGEQATLPGVIWPELAAAQPQRAARRGGRIPKPILDVVEIDIRQADRLLTEFRHPLPPASRRPFGRMCFALRAFQQPVAVCVSASAPNPSVHKGHDLHRHNSVELARIARRDPPATLAALRLWRTYLAPMCSPNGTPAQAGAGTRSARRSPTRCPARPPAHPTATASTAATDGPASAGAD